MSESETVELGGEPVKDGGLGYRPEVSFDPESAPGIELRRAPTGHLMVHPRLNGRDVGWFILDSGAANSTIDPRVAEGLKLEETAQVECLSIRGKTPAAVREAEELRIGPVRIAKPRLVDLDMEQWRLGVETSGIVGWELFSRAVIELELATDELSAHDPDAYELEGAGWRPLTFHFNLPHVTARFEGEREGLFRIDLGAAVCGPLGNVTFHTGAVEDLGLLDGRAVTRETKGALELAFGSIDWFELGGVRFEDPEVAFSLADPGCFSDARVTGNLGGGFLAPFRVVFDYAHARIAFVQR